MKYSTENRVYRIGERGDAYFYVASSPAAAVLCHRRRHLSATGKLEAHELTPETQVRRFFDDTIDAFAAMVGATSAEAVSLRQGLGSLGGGFRFDGHVSVGRAAADWARCFKDGNAHPISDSVI